jgi:hypothetical protein
MTYFDGIRSLGTIRKRARPDVVKHVRTAKVAIAARSCGGSSCLHVSYS